VAGGAVVKICRHGRPVAALSPLLDAPVRRATARSPDQDSNAMTPLTPEEEDQLGALDATQRCVLEGLSDGCSPDQLAVRNRKHEPSAIAVALGRLEIARLIVKDFGGYSLTMRGARLAREVARGSG
jgi:antitoxin (DNA-binding transcriptional repressor) of toxin-antitoxin stability system